MLGAAFVGLVDRPRDACRALQCVGIGVCRTNGAGERRSAADAKAQLWFFSAGFERFRSNSVRIVIARSAKGGEARHRAGHFGQ
jgi:hypothetical protein